MKKKNMLLLLMTMAAAAVTSSGLNASPINGIVAALGRAQTNVAKLLFVKALLLYAEAFLFPLKAI
jgi:hypothetical protein